MAETEEELNARQRYEKSKAAMPQQPAQEEQKTGLAGFHQRGMEAAKGTAVDAGRGISKALMGSAFESFGKAFDGGGYTPRGMRPDTSYLNNWREMGARTQKLMEDRWHMSEFKQFKKSMLDPFQANLQELQDGANTLGQELSQGRWPTIDGTPAREFDMNNEADRMEIMRLRGQLEKDLIMKATDMHIALNNEAASKYANNPIVDDMISKMMNAVTKQNTSQFSPTQSMAAGAQEAGIRDTNANTRYKDALTDKTQAETRSASAKGTNYMSTTEVMRDMDPKAAVQYFTNHVRGKELLEGNSAFPGYLDAQEVKLRKQFRANKKWSDADALVDVNAAAENDYIKENGTRLFRRSIGEFVKGEYGEEAYQAAGAGIEGILPDEPLPFEHDITTNPTKKETKKKGKEWNTLGTEMADRALRADPDLSREDAIDWLMNEWFPNAMDGRSIEKGQDPDSVGYSKQLDGLTASEKNAAAAPYIKKIRELLRPYAEKWVGTGEQNEGLLPEQKPDTAPRTRGARRARAMRDVTIMGASAATPAALFPGIAKTREGLYPEDFREQHPDERTAAQKAAAKK
jgi:hypothetical protein